MRFLFLGFISFLCFSCTQSQKKPSFITFKFKNDSVQVFATNILACPTHSITESLNTKSKEILEFQPFEKKLLFTSEKDTVQILKDFKFRMLFGISTTLKRYDTVYNYALPFLKGKRYKILQGQNTNFTHKGSKSKYAIDFRMNIGQTVCAMKDGVVVAIKEDSNKGGSNKKYLNDGNYVMLYHKDGLFTQYVHLRKDGVLVNKGDAVKKGQPIAYSGNTGMSTEPHLHFGVYKATPVGFINTGMSTEPHLHFGVYKATPMGFTSIPYILDSIPTKKYKKGKYANNN